MDNPPMLNCTKRYMVLRIKDSNKLMWTSGGEYRADLYELLFEGDDLDEAIDFYMKKNYDRK